MKKAEKKTPAFRIAPSPTGQMHIGTLGMALCNMMLAKNMGGKNYVRIEDTDQAREVEGATESLLKEFAFFEIKFDNEPIIQSQRIEIYKKYAEKLISEGKAYRDEGAVRFKAPPKTEITWTDLIKGEMKLPGLERDPVILKSNGYPPYNLAANVDDYLMGITHVLRGEEWLPSTAEHIQLRHALGFGVPNYAHMPVLCVLEDGKKRKLSKRKDKQALAGYFIEQGYPKQAVIEYLLTVYNTDYELWRTDNPDKDWRDFPFRFEKIGSNSPLFDWDKLNDISKNIIAKMSCEQINAEVKKYFGDKLTPEQYEKVFTLLAVERGTDRPRKDIAKFSEILTEFDFIFKPVKMTPLLKKYAELVKSAKDKDQWFTACKDRAVEFGFKNVREFTQAVRLELTGREKSTDLYTISKLLLQDK